MLISCGDYHSLGINVYYSITGSKELGYAIDVTFDGIQIDKRLVDQKEKIVESIRKAIEEFIIKKLRVVNNAYDLNKVNFLNIEDPLNNQNQRYRDGNMLENENARKN